MKPMIKRRAGTPLLLALALLVPAGAAGQRHFPADEDLELMLRYLVEDGEAPGIVMGVLDPDGSTRAVGYGSAAPAAGPPGPRSIFEIGALTMTFTATLLADMVARGEVRTEDPVAKYLPEQVSVPAPGGYRMTLSDLATHRSGLPAGPGGGTRDFSLKDLYDRVADADLERPGRRYAFSHLGYALLGHALARAAGVPYEELLRERVLEPLGMHDTGYTPTGEAAEWMVAGHADGQVVARTVAPEAMRGATGLQSSARDLLRFLKANVGSAGPDEPATDLERAMRSAREIRVERGSPDEDVGYGFSWRTHSVAREPPIVSHAGGTPGFSALLAFDAVQGIGTVLLANTTAFDDWIGRTLLLFGPPASTERVAVDPDILQRYEGTYKVNVGQYTAAHGGGHFFIRLEDEGYLTYQPRGLVRTRLYALSDSSFYMLRGPITVTVNALADDVRMVLHVDEREPLAANRGWRAWKVDDEMPAPAVVAGNVGYWQRWGAGVRALIILAGLLVVAAILSPVWSGWRRRRETGAV